MMIYLHSGQETRVMVTRKQMYLPTRSTPIVVQRLTVRQIAAIPQNRYAIAVIGSTGEAMAIPAMRIGRMSLSYSFSKWFVNNCQ